MNLSMLNLKVVPHDLMYLSIIGLQTHLSNVRLVHGHIHISHMWTGIFANWLLVSILAHTKLIIDRSSHMPGMFGQL